MRTSTPEEFESFLSDHEPFGSMAMLRIGDEIDGWRVTALLGKGGNAEVYRAERKVRGDRKEVAALKILVKDGDAAKARFRREVELLSKNWHTAFPRFYGEGGLDSRPYYLMEILSPVELPSTDADVAKYILSVANAVAILHRAGMVHRDIKPQNVMRRANGELVLIDLGLVRPISGRQSASGITVTVDGQGVAVGSGTPRYAAPEQFNGGAVSPATDIHALGMLANECFAGSPPKAWERIVSRSTSSIPERRYGDVNALAKAIRHRHSGRIAAWCGIAVAVIVVSVMIWSANRGGLIEAALPTWRDLACDVRTNVVERQMLYEKLTTNDLGMVVAVDRQWRDVTNYVKGTVIRLKNERHSFAAPMILETNRAYWIVGPGTLDVSLSGKSGSKVHLDNCVLINRTTNAVAACGVHYVFGKGAYLNFINLDRNEQTGYNAYMEDFDGAYNDLEFKGPETLKALLKRRDDESHRWLEREN